jgi:hypothetical protein
MGCKKQIDNIAPWAVLTSFSDASDWLYKQRQWRQVNLQGSINKDTLKLDRAGQATNMWFWHVSHDLLTRLLKFELLSNNVLQAVGTLWHHDTRIPMGGPFSAQSVDLHTLWKIKRLGKKLPECGELHVSDNRYDYWCRGSIWFRLCQFKDNILLASNLPVAETPRVQMCVCVIRWLHLTLVALVNPEHELLRGIIS